MSSRSCHRCGGREPYPGRTMSQMRLNPLNGRWVTIVPDRAERPSDFAPRDEQRRPDARSAVPVLPRQRGRDPAGGRDRRSGRHLVDAGHPEPLSGVRRRRRVHRPQPRSGPRQGRGERHPRGVRLHAATTTAASHQLDDEHAAELMFVLKRRLAEHAALPFVRYTQVIVNHGREAGASVAHPHGQILGLPFVPERGARRGAGVRPLRRWLAARAPRSKPNWRRITGSSSPTTTSW